MITKIRKLKSQGFIFHYIYADREDAFQLAQEAMKEISILCFPKLSKPIELEIKL